jgi:hypothetical protein
MQEHTNDLDLAAGLDYLDDRHERVEAAINQVLSNPHRGQLARELPDKWKCYSEMELRICLREILSKFGI